MAIRHTYWVRQQTTISEKKVCLRKIIYSFIILLFGLFLLYLLEGKIDVGHFLDSEMVENPIMRFFGSVLIIFFILFLDGILILFNLDNVCVSGPNDHAMRDKWYYCFIPHTDIMSLAFVIIGLIPLLWSIGPLTLVFIKR